MDAKPRVVTQLPLEQLWRDDGFTTTSRLREFGFDNFNEIEALLSHGPVQFVVVGEGSPPCWIPIEDCHRFWKDEFPESYLEPRPGAELDGCPDVPSFCVSEWAGANADAVPIIVYEVYR